MLISRRTVLKAAVTAVPAVAGLGAVTTLGEPTRAGAAPLGVLLDYSAGVIPAAELRAAGAAGAIRYVSERRPGADWMLGKPMQAAEAEELRGSGLAVVSNYQFGKRDTADWLGGADAGADHARRGAQLHAAAGGPEHAPIYVSIDDAPSFEQYRAQVAPYLRAWESVIGHDRTGVYANAATIGWALDDGIGRYFWQHNWGSPGGVAHPAANLHQVEIDARTVDGVGVDVNHILTPQYGQWA